MEVEVHQGRRLVPGEGRAHDAVVQAGEQRLPADAALLRQHGHLGERLDHGAEEEVVAELDRAGQLAFADIGRARAEDVQVGMHGVERRRPDPDTAKVSRRRWPPSGCPSPGRRAGCSPAGGELRADHAPSPARTPWSSRPRSTARGPRRGHPGRADQRVDQVLRGADGHEQDVDGSQVGGAVHDLGARPARAARPWPWSGCRPSRRSRRRAAGRSGRCPSARSRASRAGARRSLPASVRPLSVPSLVRALPPSAASLV